MDMTLVYKAAVLLVFAVAMIGINLKAGTTILRPITFYLAIAALLGAAYFTVMAVLS